MATRTLYDRIDVFDRGAWEPSPARPYEIGDGVTYGGVAYVAIKRSAGISPFDRRFWRPESDYDTPYGGLVDITTEHESKLGDLIGAGVYSGLAVSAQTVANLTVKIGLGVVYMPSKARVALAALASLPITVDAAKPSKGIVYIASDLVQKYLAALGTAAVAGSRAYTIATNAAATDTVTVVGVAFTAVESDPTAVQFIPGEDAAATAAALAPALAANETIAALYNVTVAGAVITLTEKVAGAGNTPAVATFTGTLVVTNGTAVTSAAAAYPAAAPTLPTGGVLLAEIALLNGATTVAAENITDKRSAASIDFGTIV